MLNEHNRASNMWRGVFLFSIAGILGIAVTALGAADYFDRKPSNTNYAANKPVIKGATYDDIRQGQAPTCSLLASLSAAAHSGIDLSKNIKHLGGKDYSVKLFIKNEWADVKVSFKGWVGHDPVANDAGEFWVALYQRAYLRAFGVDCSDADGNKWKAAKDSADWLRMSVALRTVTGEQVDIWWLEAKDPAGAVKRVRAALEKKRCIVIGTGVIPEVKVCLAENHAYTVMAAGADWIDVRNPWGYDISVSLLTHKASKNGKDVYAFKEGYSDGKDDNPNDGIVRVGLENIRYFDIAVATKEVAPGIQAK